MTDDLISRQAAIDVLAAMQGRCTSKAALIQNSKIWQQIKDLPSAQQEPEEFEWCTDCKEYDQTAHCCHRWTKAIRKTVDELKQAAVDAVPVIRCKECKWNKSDKWVDCPITEMFGRTTDNYCSLAERKEE